jgi:hypothetical protein
MDIDRERRRALRLLLGAGTLQAALQSALAQTLDKQGVRAAQGDIRVNGAPAAAGSPVRPGDTVTTSQGAFATFVVGRDAFLIRENSQAELIGSGALVSVLRLVSGKILGAFGSGADRRISTATATIGIRGTGAYTEAEPARTYFCLCYGTADVAAVMGGAHESYSTTHHESPRYIYGDGRERAIVPASVVNHTDTEIIMLEALVGRTPPQSFMEGPYMSNPYH